MSNENFSRRLCSSLNGSGYVRGVAKDAALRTPYTQVDLANGPPLNGEYHHALVRCYIIRIRLFDNAQIQMVMRERIRAFPGEDIPLDKGMFRVYLIEGDELLELSLSVDEGTDEVIVEFTHMSIEEQWRWGWRHNIGATEDTTLCIGTLREDPDSVPNDEQLITMIHTLCLRTGVDNTVRLGGAYGLENTITHY